MPLLVPVLVLGRDLVLLSGLGFAADKGYELSVIYLGKTATFVLMTSLAGDADDARNALAGRAAVHRHRPVAGRGSRVYRDSVATTR